MSVAPLFIGAAGVALILIIVWDAFETILVPRRIGRRVRFTRYFYRLTWRAWRAVALRIRTASRRETVLGFYGPLSLIVLLSCWAAGLIFGFALLTLITYGHAGSAPTRFDVMLYMSGQTFFTLGFGDLAPTTGAGRFLAVLEAGLGFGFLATVIGYLPTMYAGFAQREVEISLMDARAGSPPTALEFLARAAARGDEPRCEELLRAWERWAAQLLETHISYPQLGYYRSQHINQSWLACLTTILDSTSVLLARPNAAYWSQARFTFAMARHALVDIAQIFVHDFVPGDRDRMTPESARLLSEQAVGDSPPADGDAEFHPRLTTLRRMYEPYAQALAAHLLFELPPWSFSRPRRDNWHRGPWDQQLSAPREPDTPHDDHF